MKNKVFHFLFIFLLDANCLKAQAELDKYRVLLSDEVTKLLQFRRLKFVT